MEMSTICFVILCSVTVLQGASLRGVIYRYARGANARAVSLDRRPAPSREPIAPIVSIT